MEISSVYEGERHRLAHDLGTSRFLFDGPLCEPVRVWASVPFGSYQVADFLNKGWKV